MKKINLDALSLKYRISDYKELYAKVIALIESQQIKPVKASGINGKSPALYREYWIIELKQDVTKYLDELNYEIVPVISTDYYQTHIEQYIQDRIWVLLLNNYIKKNPFHTLMSENERSFDIWHREKIFEAGTRKKDSEALRTRYQFFELLQDNRANCVLFCNKENTAKSCDNRE